MFGFGSTVPERECAVIIDIGSGSAGAALIVSDIAEDAVTCLLEEVTGRGTVLASMQACSRSIGCSTWWG